MTKPLKMARQNCQAEFACLLAAPRFGFQDFLVLGSVYQGDWKAGEFSLRIKKFISLKI